jgi:hypothetical protein
MVYEREREGEGVWAEDEVVNRKEPKPDSSFLKPPQPPDKSRKHAIWNPLLFLCPVY